MQKNTLLILNSWHTWIKITRNNIYGGESCNHIIICLALQTPSYKIYTSFYLLSTILYSCKHSVGANTLTNVNVNSTSAPSVILLLMSLICYKQGFRTDSYERILGDVVSKVKKILLQAGFSSVTNLMLLFMYYFVLQ